MQRMRLIKIGAVILGIVLVLLILHFGGTWFVQMLTSLHGG